MPLRPLSRLAAVADNGMLYKDITQWLRQRTFTLLFIGLMVVCELIAVILGTRPISPADRPGAIAFGFMSALLSIYGLITAVNGNVTTAREFGDRTFELYALAGMSLEKMVFGKLLSMMAQFIFGACCIVPFMFFAYLLGGLDFYTILANLLIAFMLAPPIFLLALLVAGYQKQRNLRVASRVVIVLLLIILLNGLSGLWFFMRFRGGFGSPSAFVSDLLSGSPAAWGAFAMMLLMYVQICGVIFYLCAHAMRPATDSRQHIVKALLFSLLGCVALSTLWDARHHGFSNSYPAFFLIAFFLMLWIGAACFYGPLRVPIIIRRKREALRDKRGPWALLKRWGHAVFAPSAFGLFISLIWFLLLVLAFAGALFKVTQSKLSADDLQAFLQYLSYPLSVPFFLSFPAVFFYSFDRTARMKHIAMLVFACWIFGAVAGWVLLGIQSSNPEFLGNAQQYMLLWGMTFISPFSTLGSELAAKGLSLKTSFYAKRIVLGAVGMFLMWRILRRRAALETKYGETE